jgi:hypothetical protein
VGVSKARKIIERKGYVQIIISERSDGFAARFHNRR